MTIEIIETSMPAVSERIVHHLGSIASRVNSFMESHIQSSTPWLITVDGYLTVRDDSTLSQFTLSDGAMRHGHEIFLTAQEQCRFTRALVPTVDQVFLAHAMDRQQSVTVQAFQFALGPRPTTLIGQEVQIHPATADDRDAISRHSGDFFEPIDHWIESGGLLIGRRNGELVGFGALERHLYQPGSASIGMFTVEGVRGQGVGTAIIRALIFRWLALGLEPVAGCWSGNLASKRTLEAAGMVNVARLLAIEVQAPS